MSEKARLVVLISGSGSNLQAIIDACSAGNMDAEIMAVVSDRKDAFGLKRAEKANIPTVHHSWRPYKEAGKSRDEYDADLANIVKSYQPDLVILAGWMRLLSMAFLKHYHMRVINLHPARPGTFPGTHAIDRAYESFQNGEISETGVMVHFVPDEGVDDGPVIAVQPVPIYPEDTLELLEERIHTTEHQLLVEAVQNVIIHSIINQGE